MRGLGGKVAIVTGGSKGIGAATAVRLAAEGASVVVNYARSAADADAVVATIVDGGGDAIAVRADVSVPADVERLFAAAHDRFGALDVLVNNAGPLIPAPFDLITPQIVEATVAQNFTSVVLCTRAAVARFGDRGGVVVNLSSETVRHVLLGSAVFASVKSAVEVFTRDVAQELGPRGVRVVCVSPGYTVTSATQGLPPELVDRMVARTALRRPGLAPDVASVIAFLASEDGAWITGTTIAASGGLEL